MYKKYLLSRSRCVMPLDIQFFAEGGGDGAGTDNGNGGGSGSEGDKGTGAGAGAEGEGSKGEEGKPLTFDTFLKIPENQAEFDRRVQQAIGTATTRLKGDYEVMGGYLTWIQGK